MNPLVEAGIGAGLIIGLFWIVSLLPDPVIEEAEAHRVLQSMGYSNITCLGYYYVRRNDNDPYSYTQRFRGTSPNGDKMNGVLMGTNRTGYNVKYL